MKGRQGPNNIPVKALEIRGMKPGFYLLSSKCK